MTQSFSLWRWCICGIRSRPENPQPRRPNYVKEANVAPYPRSTEESIVASSEHEDRTLDSPADVNNSTTNLSNHSRIERPSTPKLAATEDSPQAGPLSLPGSELRVNFDTPTQQESNAPNWALSRRQNPIESESNLRNHNRASELQAELFGARIEWPEGGYRHFIPISVLEQSITFESVGIELRRCRGRFLDQVVHRETALEIMSNARKLFAILVYLGQSQYIWELLNEKLDDKDLPLVRSDKTTNFKLCSKLHPRKPIRCLADWERSNIDEFARDQWSMMAPIFKHTEEVSHLELDDNDVLPFTEDNEHSNQGVEYGGFGSVWEVKIHHAHHDLYISTKVLNPSFAVKRLYSRGEKQFKAEVEMLKAFSRSRCPHLVKLLATFRHKGHYYLLFPWAKSNLRKYWEYTPRPDFSEATVLWSLEQCKALASGLLRIHEHETTHDSFNQRAEIQPALSEHNSPGTEKGDRLYGRHGDIKPENILWTSDDQNHLNTMGILLIADFGLMEFHTQLTRSLVLPGNLRGSQTYEPPERRLRTQISRAYDIWSLGCVYLEFITWLVCGMQGLERFPLARGITMDKVNDDTFYTIIDDGLDPSPRGIVRESVQEWIKDLHEQPRCSDFIHDFLNLVSEHMLVVNPGKRIRCGLLVDRFCSMVRDASKASNYLTTGTPSEPRAHQADLTTPRTPSVSAVDGASLPQYPGTAYSHEEMLCVSPQIEPEVLESLSPSSSPNLSMKEFGMK